MSYDFSDLLMYSREVYLYYLRDYGEAFRYVRWWNLLLALVIPVLVWTPSVPGGPLSRHRHRIVSVLLAYLWAWIGLAFHWTYFTPINYAAYGFVVLFLMEALLLLLFGTVLGTVEFQSPRREEGSSAGSLVRTSGLVLYLFALLGQPAISWFTAGDLFHFGWTAGATSLGTMGLVLLVRGSLFSFLLMPLPFLHAAWAALRANAFGLPEQYGLAAGCLLVACGMIVSRFTSPESPGEQPPSPPPEHHP